MSSSRLVVLVFAFITFAVVLVGASPAPGNVISARAEPPCAMDVMNNLGSSVTPILDKIDNLVETKTATTENIIPLLNEVTVVINVAASSLQIVSVVTSLLQIANVAQVTFTILAAINTTLLGLLGSGLGLDLGVVVSLVNVATGDVLKILVVIAPGLLPLGCEIAARR
ncbi:uncharacterized protein EV420DRAFT_604844 [Desarmillaria tabescens]|uniref:Transmembrane protein n=1 Tax=Armillaria tabescens TaxID=1929756 RepID=A0AA39K467_ARMTA|nr:uncharacterized protein EV420DRAFT_604844 [Desarmillaria tabescens]KAK0454195.1 hypothetical protein EV420DRAFT_604844 [Desarmillaria tabescens]